MPTEVAVQELSLAALLLVPGLLVLSALVVGYFFGRKENVPQRERQLAENFERGVRQLDDPEPSVRVFGVLGLEGVALASARHRPHVLRELGEFLRLHAHTRRNAAVVVLQTEEKASMAADVDVRAIVEALGRLTRRARAIELSQLNLSATSLTGAHLPGANLSGINMAHCSLTSADLTGAALRGVDLTGADLRFARLHRANLSANVPRLLTFGLTAPLKDLIIVGVSLPLISGALTTVLGGLLAFLGIAVGATFALLIITALIVLRIAIALYTTAVNFIQYLTNQKHVRHIVEQIMLTRSVLENADLRHADLTQANLYGANLKGARLAYADVKGALFHRAHLEGADLSLSLNLYQAQVDAAFIDERTLLPPHIRRRHLSSTGWSGEVELPVTDVPMIERERETVSIARDE